MKYALCFSLAIACVLNGARANIDPNDVNFVFYSRDNFNGVKVPHNANPNLPNIHRLFDPSLPTVVLVHGWQDNYEADSNTFVRGSVLSKVNANIIKVNWGPLSNQGYFAARDSVPFVGRIAADLLGRISETFSYSLSDVTLVGFSLGAHVSGNIGKALSGRIGVIVALDPAGPFISSSDINFSVHPSDAQYVQGIHTNAGTLGMSDPVGHSDFYPNGGSRQPGCGIDLLGSCAHNRAWEFFAESVTANRFASSNCASWDVFRNGRCTAGQSTLMGGLATINRSARGSFFLETNNQAPFGRG